MISSLVIRSSPAPPAFAQATDKNMVVFFGSQTGTAEEFAGRIAKDAKLKGFKPMTADPQVC
jgi:NADPH-ferrihemoprotein reductase